MILFVLFPCFQKAKISSLHFLSLTSMPQSHKQGGVMWPRLVSNKLLQRALASNCFVTDIPSTEVLLEAESSDHVVLPLKPFDDPKETHKYKLFVRTWNVGGVSPTDDLNLEDWLDTNNNSYDIYVLGFQEIVPLSTKNILWTEKSKISMKWNSLIRATLNKSNSKPQRSQETNMLGEKQKVYPVKNGCSMGNMLQDFQCIISKQMVGIMISIWVRIDLQRYIRYLDVSCIGCGFLGCLGNKGSVSVRFCLHETSFCFVCCHLASGGKEGDEIHRNSDALKIFSRTIFPEGLSLGLPRRIMDHDRVILLGDLNYRISLPEDKTRSLVEQKEWSILLQNDQLRSKVSEGRVFECWHEGAITFLPTYKYYPNSDRYYGCCQGTKGKKWRAPAWCDRILWHGKGLKQLLYDRSELRLSDHRAVQAVFTAEVEFQRLNNIVKHVDMFPSELSNGRTSLYV